MLTVRENTRRNAASGFKPQAAYRPVLALDPAAPRKVKFLARKPSVARARHRSAPPAPRALEAQNEKAALSPAASPTVPLLARVPRPPGERRAEAEAEEPATPMTPATPGHDIALELAPAKEQVQEQPQEQPRPQAPEPKPPVPPRRRPVSAPVPAPAPRPPSPPPLAVRTQSDGARGGHDDASPYPHLRGLPRVSVLPSDRPVILPRPKHAPPPPAVVAGASLAPAPALPHMPSVASTGSQYSAGSGEAPVRRGWLDIVRLRAAAAQRGSVLSSVSAYSND
ncbi:hypothetical protein BC834DRAFT_590837 [Gloeopeniophorella convolvens]|nr:hypothetical protein BC834DRAFT_590837 [Gloeopeniophorella convolvens]